MEDWQQLSCSIYLRSPGMEIVQLLTSFEIDSQVDTDKLFVEIVRLRCLLRVPPLSNLVIASLGCHMPAEAHTQTSLIRMHKQKAERHLQSGF